jgi:hypothetical protein
MKSSLLIFLASATICLAGGESMKPYTGSAEFEKLKTLAGTWKGTTDMGKGPVTVMAQYRVVSGGSAVEERLFADTPKEMITIYHDQDGKLALTHYCMLCNRPAMSLVKAEGKSLSFDLTKDCGIKVDTEMHMHALTLTLDDPDHLTHDWTLYQDGKAGQHSPFQFERVK